ncbi:MAG: hypothetical protein ACXVCE_06390 [Bacteriovorax sp.]
MKSLLLCLTTVMAMGMTGVASASVSNEQLGLLKNKLIDLYGGTVQSRGATLDVVFNFDSAQEGAFSKKIESENKWQITVNGGMIRLPQMNGAAMGLILCHEVGHFLGGQPYVQGKKISPIMTSSAPKQMSVEGQADFFATADCGKKLFQAANITMDSASSVPASLAQPCVDAGTNLLTCMALLEASKRVADIYGDIINRAIHIDYGAVSYTQKDPSEVNRTLYYVGEYPGLQCRMDTMVAGLSCHLNPYGECTQGELRPRCWYLPE